MRSTIIYVIYYVVLYFNTNHATTCTYQARTTTSTTYCSQSLTYGSKRNPLRSMNPLYKESIRLATASDFLVQRKIMR